MPWKLRLIGGAKGHNTNDSTLPGSAALRAGSFKTRPSVSMTFLKSSYPWKEKTGGAQASPIPGFPFSIPIRSEWLILSLGKPK